MYREDCLVENVEHSESVSRWQGKTDVLQISTFDFEDMLATESSAGRQERVMTNISSSIELMT